MSRTSRIGARFLVLLAISLGLYASFMPSWSVTAQNSTGLQNGGFEGGWHEQGAGELVIPNGWTLEYRDGSHPWCPPPCNRPEVKPNEEYVIGGRYSVRSFTTFSRGLYGIYQEIDAEPGIWYTFSCQTRLDSNPPGELAAFVGIQPWGGGLFERQMVWGQETQAQLEWQTVGVTAQAYGSRIRVAMGANNKWATRDNTVWWDDCRLEIADFGNIPTPEPTAMPRPTPTPCPECPPCTGDCDENAIAQAVVEALRDWFSGLRWGVVP